MCPALCISRNMSHQSISEFLRTSYSLIFACLPQLFSNVSSSYKVKLFHLNFLKCSLGGTFLHWVSSESGKIKTALQVVSLREPPDRSNNNISLERRLWSNSQPHSAPSCGFQASYFHCNCRLLFFKATTELERGMGIGQIKALQSSLPFLKFSYFSEVNAPQIYNILLISVILKYFILTFFFPVFSLLL